MRPQNPSGILNVNSIPSASQVWLTENNWQNEWKVVMWVKWCTSVFVIQIFLCFLVAMIFHPNCKTKTFIKSVFCLLFSIGIGKSVNVSNWCEEPPSIAVMSHFANNYHPDNPQHCHPQNQRQSSPIGCQKQNHFPSHPTLQGQRARSYRDSQRSWKVSRY